MSLAIIRASSSGAVAASNEPAKGQPLFDEFYTVGHLVGEFRWVSSANGGSTGVVSTFDSNTTWGVVEFSTSTSATACPSLLGVWPFVYFGAGTREFQARVRIENLSTATEDFTSYWGFGNGYANNTLTNGVFFRYNHAINGGNITFEAMKASTSTRVDTGIVVALGEWYTLKVIVAADGLSAEGFIDGVSIGTISTNIPLSTTVQGVMLMHQKTLGTTARKMWVDFSYFNPVQTVAR